MDKINIGGDVKKNTYISGMIVGILASAFWGVSAIFFKQMDAFLPLEIASHRVAWTVVCLTIFGCLTARQARLKHALSNWRELSLIMLSAALMGLNWFTFIYAVLSNQIVEAGLGYFIYPLMVVAVGVVFLGEKLGPWEWIVVGLAAIGVALKSFENGGIPVIALTVSATFTLYTLLGKTRNASPVVGIWAECIVLAPLAVGYLILLYMLGEGRFLLGGAVDTGLAIATGPVTALPFILYITSSRTIGMATAGLLFYITPILHVVVGAVIYKEPFTYFDAAAFAVLWAGLAILTVTKITSDKTKGA